MKLRVSECANQHLRLNLKPKTKPYSQRERAPSKRFDDFYLFGDIRSSSSARSQSACARPLPSILHCPLTSQLLGPLKCCTSHCIDSWTAAASAALVEAGPPVPADTQSVPAPWLGNASGLSCSSAAASTQLQVPGYPRSSKAPIQKINCTNCGIDHSPAWRLGPAGPKTLCNRCGLRFNRHGPDALMPGSTAKAPTLKGPQPSSSAEAASTVNNDKILNISTRSSRVEATSQAPVNTESVWQATGSDSHWQECCNDWEGTKRSNTRGHPQGLKRKRSSDGEDSVKNCYSTCSKKAAYCVVAAADDGATASGADGPSEMEVDGKEAEAVELLASVAQLAGGRCGVRISRRIAQRRSKQQQEESMAEVTAAAEVLLHMAGCR